MSLFTEQLRSLGMDGSMTAEAADRIEQLEAAQVACIEALEKAISRGSDAVERTATLEAALREIAAPSKRKGPPDFQYWWDVANDRREIARAALAVPSTHQPCPGCDGHECDKGCAYPGAISSTKRGA
jgi:hypothetical protein